jgi:hypothetical protein
MQSTFEAQSTLQLQATIPVDRYRELNRNVTNHGYTLPSNEDFVMLLDAYRDLGGLARAQEVASMTASRCGTTVRTLASWIVDRQGLSFEWQSQIWIPLFQFDRASMALSLGLTEVLAVLSHVFAPWEQALWFARPNDCLGDRIPAHVLVLDHEAVARAAHADQLVAAG